MSTSNCAQIKRNQQQQQQQREGGLFEFEGNFENASRRMNRSRHKRGPQAPLSASLLGPSGSGLSKNLILLSVFISFCCLTLSQNFVLIEAKTTFEKMTNRDYLGSTYYSIQNVSLFECLGWCKDENSCTSAVFSFVVNPFAALQETTCMLQNETQARQTAYLRQTSSNGNSEQVTIVANPQKATNLYFFNKIELQSEAVCSRLWAFERFPNKKLRQRDHQSFHSPSKEACQTACMNEQRFVCRSLEYNYISQLCTLNGYDRRSPLILHLANQALSHSGANDLIEAPGTDYFENACLLGEDICNESRIYDYAKIGMPLHRIAHFVELNYYPDKEMLVKSQAGCVRACTIEHEFICRSILYRSSFKQGQPNCALYHLDQKTFPEGSDAFMSQVMQPLLDSGETSAVYLEAVCNDTINLSVLNQVGSSGGQQTTITMPPTSITIMPSSTTPGGISVHTSSPSSLGAGGSGNLASGVGGGNNHAILTIGPGGSASLNSGNQHNSHLNHSHHNEERYISSTSTLSPINGGNSQSVNLIGIPTSATTIRLPTTFLPQTINGNIPSNIQIQDLQSSGSSSNVGRPMIPSHITINDSSGTRVTPSRNNQIGSIPSHIVISPATPPSRENQLIIETSNNQISASGNGNINHDQNCDAHGFCYDVSLKCTDTKMVVNVKTQRPFHGRIYALGRSETCNANIKNMNQFQLDMYLTGQECNTQSASGTYTNTIVLQHHNVVLTKADKVYHVRCTYETASRNVSFGMMPVKDMFEVDVNDRNQETISITASSDAPLPKINILTSEGKEASTVRIGDRLTFRIEIPDSTPYGIFARSCIAMAKDARSTFEIIDEHGCPVDHTIFPNFLPVANGNALESSYEAFRFTESYGVIFQCNVKYCIGKCEPVNCGIGRESVEAWGRKKRSIGSSALDDGQKPESAGGNRKQLGDDMTLSREIVVLDIKEKDSSQAAATSDSNSSQAADSNQPENAQRSPLRAQPDASGASMDSGSPATTAFDLTAGKHCLSSQSLFVLICSIGLFFILYVCVVAYFFARRDPKISAIKHQYH